VTSLRFKMGSRQGARRTHPAPLLYSCYPLVSRGQHKSGAGRNRRATQPPTHFQRNPLGRGQLAVFPRCSLDPYGRFARALKNSQRWTRRVLAGTQKVGSHLRGDRVFRWAALELLSARRSDATSPKIRGMGPGR
jgi:hypothetical protein